MVARDIHTPLHTHGSLSIIRGLFSAPCMGILELQLGPSELAPLIAELSGYSHLLSNVCCDSGIWGLETADQPGESERFVPIHTTSQGYVPQSPHHATVPSGPYQCRDELRCLDSPNLDRHHYSFDDG